MKKFFCLMLAVVLAAVLPLTAMAREQPLSVTAESAQDRVYVTVALTAPLMGSTMGVSSSFDAALWQPVPGESRWVAEGLLSDFNQEGYGVWAARSEVALSGDMVVLAFRPLSPEAVSAPISCTLIVKRGDEEVLRHTAAVTVQAQSAPSQPTEPAPPAAQPNGSGLLWLLVAAVVLGALGAVYWRFRKRKTGI